MGLKEALNNAGIKGEVPTDPKEIGAVMDKLVKLTPSIDLQKAKQEIVDGELSVIERIPDELKLQMNAVLPENEQLET